MTDVKYDIFIAYKREDRRTANLLLTNFEAQGLRVFIDANINAGLHFSVELEQALNAPVPWWFSGQSNQKPVVMFSMKLTRERSVACCSRL